MPLQVNTHTCTRAVYNKKLYVAAQRALSFDQASCCLVFFNFCFAVIQSFNQIHRQQAHNIWDWWCKEANRSVGPAPWIVIWWVDVIGGKGAAPMSAQLRHHMTTPLLSYSSGLDCVVFSIHLSAGMIATISLELTAWPRRWKLRHRKINRKRQYCMYTWFCVCIGWAV